MYTGDKENLHYLVNKNVTFFQLIDYPYLYNDI